MDKNASNPFESSGIALAVSIRLAAAATDGDTEERFFDSAAAFLFFLLLALSFLEFGILINSRGRLLCPFVAGFHKETYCRGTMKREGSEQNASYFNHEWGSYAQPACFGASTTIRHRRIRVILSIKCSYLHLCEPLSTGSSTLHVFPVT